MMTLRCRCLLAGALTLVFGVAPPAFAAAGSLALLADGPEVSLPSPGGQRQVCPRVAAAYGVRAVVWGAVDTATPAAGADRWQGLFLARLDEDGTPLGVTRIVTLATPRHCGEFDVAVTTRGEIVVGWREGAPSTGRVLAAWFDDKGREMRRVTIRESRDPLPGLPDSVVQEPLLLRVVVEDDGEIHVAWVELAFELDVSPPYQPLVLIRSIRPDGELVGDRPFVPAGGRRFSLAALPDDGLVASFRDSVTSEGAGWDWSTLVFFRATPPSRWRFFDSELTDRRVFRLSDGFATLSQPAAAEGHPAGDGRYRFQAFDLDGRERGVPFSLPLALDPGAELLELAVVEEAYGRLLVVWREEPADDGATGVSLQAQVVSGEGRALSPPFVFGAAPAACPPSLAVASPHPGRAFVAWRSEARAMVRPLIVRSAELPLRDGEFRVSVTWDDGAGKAGSGVAVPLTSDTGYFWFFRDGNAELVTKVLDGRPVNGHFWVFGGALTNVAYTVEVEHPASDTTRVYHNPQGRLASFGDTTAFPGSVAAGTGTSAPRAGAGSGFPAPPELMLGAGGRFRLILEWHDPRSGAGGVGRAVPLSSDTGYFWFFREGNLELMVKVLDGRPVNGRFWVFGAGLSDVAYTLTVIDTATGKQRTYRKEAFEIESFADTAAF